ncbi:hypothetical protein D3C71_1666660 [compost metagenome]
MLVVLKSFAACGEGNFFAKFPIVGISDKRKIAREIQGKKPAFFFVGFSQSMCSLYSTLWKSGKIFFVCYQQLIGIGFGEDILSEFQF